MANEYANNPYFLPGNENPGFVLTSQPLTSLENYTSWARSVFLALSSSNKFGFVNGSITELDPFSPLFNYWSRCNTTILSWLINSLSMELKASVMYTNNAKDLWFDLKDRHSQGNTPRLFELGKKNRSFFTRSKASKLDAQHKEHVFRLLMGLNDSYSNLIGQTC
ncbi:uncharacterized protein LOC131163376 [Malania oleifera]|uniref:uncharacterized protein LOC131163376 n=1 Tax=Malania oleifera TaxID=397392 RepID=UPI0025ADE82D|nr:uncharacterized protein LOC131163376 [Malania oleifera]